ncbi:PREDICTED: cytidine deaminase 1-like [Tarenaya hassleriana]|uniref:cytidine deaminase 1-like n=1 Tax=Tarenaya hassleriana TaxID=28532 RepID=UPI00053C272B|nr:PREDICTED: cytidine deaminase 1-like [Tarenaya hassleriana]
MDRPKFVIQPEEAETAAKRLGVSVVELLPSLVKPAKSLARPPISNFHVAAIGLGSSGRIFVGVNVEFPGLPLHHSIHAEQFLVTNLSLSGEKCLRYVAVSAAPCGHCRQFLQEVPDAPDIKILITDSNALPSRAAGDGDEFERLSSLLPHRFGPDDLLEKDVPLLLEPHDNRLTIPDIDLDCHRDGEICNGGADSGHGTRSEMMRVALEAANRSYAPYSGCPSGVAVVDCDGGVFRGWYMESAAYNPSLGPVQAAMVDYVANGGGGGYERIVGAVLVEKEGAVVRQEHTARLLLQTISPKCDFQVFHCRAGLPAS